jgi:hypothetical protein
MFTPGIECGKVRDPTVVNLPQVMKQGVWSTLYAWVYQIVLEQFTYHTFSIRGCLSYLDYRATIKRMLIG